MTGNRVIPYGCQFIDDEDIRAVEETLRSDFLTQGPKVQEFEENLAEYCGAKYAVAFSNGTAALHGAYSVVGLGEGDDFITTPLTFLATANAGVYLGANPLFGDVHSQTGNLSPEKIRMPVFEKAKMIAPVHFAGQPVDLDGFQSLASSHELKIVEDGCHAIGATYKSSRIGSCKYSDMTTFSFHPVKHITTGEGGAVTTNNPDFYEELKAFRSHGVYRNHRQEGEAAPWSYEMKSLGFNYRMSDIQAALGIVQLSKLDSFIAKRQDIASYYDEVFSGHPEFHTPPVIEGTSHSYHLYPIRLKDTSKRRKLYDGLRERNIFAQVHYIPVHTQPFYRENYTLEVSLPQAEEFYSREISLPIFPKMTEDDMKCVSEAVLQILEVGA